MKLQSILHLILLYGGLSIVNSKSNSGNNQLNGNNTKGIIRHQQTFETRLNHLVVDNIAGRVSLRFAFYAFALFDWRGEQASVRGSICRALSSVRRLSLLSS